MSYVYEGVAAVVMIARYLAQAPIELTTLECPVRLSDAGAGRARIELQQYLQGPKIANLLRVILPGGRMLQGQLIDGRNEPGGWLLIRGRQFELTPAPPANASGWNGNEPVRGVERAEPAGTRLHANREFFGAHGDLPDPRGTAACGGSLRRFCARH